MIDITRGPRYAFRRWMYRGARPHLLARLLNWPSALLQSTGLVMPDRLVTLEVPGRRTGRLVSLPIVVTEYEGERYLVAMLGPQTNWVRNVRAAGGQAVLRHGRREVVHLVEIDSGDRAPILRRYLEIAPGARAHIQVDHRAPLEEFDRIAAQIPVFRITPEPDDGERT